MMNLKKQNSFIFDTPARSDHHDVKHFVNCDDSILGRGGFGVVVRGIYKDQNVAVKIIDKCDRSKYESIHHEANILKSSHENVVKVLKIIECATYGAIIMEFFDGKNLQSIMDTCSIDLIHRLHILQDIANALSFCHANRIIHLDLKPQNILVSNRINGSRKYSCKLSDFGCSVKIDSQTLRSQSFGGTARYSAPEVLQNLPFDVSADIYSFAIIMWQLKENELPYSSIYSNEIIIWNVVKNNLRPDSINSKLRINAAHHLNVPGKINAACKSELRFTHVKKYINSPLTPKSYNKNGGKIPQIINKNLKLQEITHYGSNQKNRMLKRSERRFESCKKLFSSPKVEKEDSSSDEESEFATLFRDDEIHRRPAECVLSIESEYVKIYSRCWASDPSLRYFVDDLCDLLDNFASLLID